MNPLRLGIIGTGLAVEKLHWPALARMRDRFDVVAFANRSEDKARHFAHYSGSSMNDFTNDYETLLKRDDVDVVLISLPIPLNYPVTEAALQAGKHVICEKPAGIDINEGRDFVNLVQAHSDKTVLIAENWFYRDDLRTARRLLDQGAIGRVHLMIWRLVSQLVPRNNEFSSTPWRHDPGYIGGPHLDAGVHHTAQIRLLLGDIERINGETQHANVTHGGPSDLATTFRFASGAAGSYSAAYLDIPTPNESNDMKIYGTDGIMTISRNAIRIDRSDQDPEVHTIEMKDGGYYNEFLNFHDALHGKAPLVGTVEQTYRNMQMIDAGIASALTGTVISFDRWPVPLSPSAVPLWEPLDG